MLRVIVPNGLDLNQAVAFANDLLNLPDDNEYIFDFSNVGRIEPFALLFISSEIERYRSKRTSSAFSAVHYDRCQYAAHMGFFQAFGVKYGNMPGEAKGSSTYIPIRIYRSATIRKDAASNRIPPAQYLQGMARELTAILTRNNNGDLYETLAYCIREILRNVIEHSETEQFGLCAQYWPSKNKVSLAILDRGKGIRAGLSTNPHLTIDSDEAALNCALEAGISGVAFDGAYRDPDDAWVNSGYGLFMTSSICRQGGSFFIASGSKGLLLTEHQSSVLDTPFQGTALNLTLNTERLGNLNETLQRYSQEARNSSSISPSQSSIGFMNE